MLMHVRYVKIIEKNLNMRIRPVRVQLEHSKCSVCLQMNNRSTCINIHNIQIECVMFHLISCKLCRRATNEENEKPKTRIDDRERERESAYRCFCLCNGCGVVFLLFAYLWASVSLSGFNILFFFSFPSINKSMRKFPNRLLCSSCITIQLINQMQFSRMQNK